MGMKRRRVCLAAEGRGGEGGTEERRRGELGELEQTGNRDGVKGRARHLAIILGHLAEGSALGVPRA